jgi:hypothetical protein
VRYSAFVDNTVGTAINLNGSIVSVSNTLVASNQTNGAAVKLFHSSVDGSTFFTTNTIAANTGGGLSIQQGPTNRVADIANNIIYGNGGFDLAFANSRPLLALWLPQLQRQHLWHRTEHLQLGQFRHWQPAIQSAVSRHWRVAISGSIPILLP